MIAHLSSIQDQHGLYVEALHFEYEWTLPESAVTPETFAATYHDFSISLDALEHRYRVSKRVEGRVVITNYDPATLPNEARVHLNEEAEETLSNEVLLDIRPGYPGGNYPMHGRLRLRSFHEVLTFIGRGIDEDPEFEVALDPRTPPISENPARTLDIVEATRLPPGAGLSIELHGQTYAVRPQRGYQWNRKAFSVLYQLYQMSIATTTNTGPAITIGK